MDKQYNYKNVKQLCL